ncbi:MULTISPECIES: hypothetical protein [unclassified Campylobacter]|uniref:hypothetical protein n=1 Tax=unclassified Campylobacter TaxID=2593542 RepID=UPI0014767AB3|nr:MULTISPECIES: hypothetical protein [unclassified Campylobacter]QKG29382.1 hypothetical protein CDOMF_1124 [Campylobacter sp. RM16187]
MPNKNKNKKSGSGIVSIDAYTQNSYIFLNNEFSECNIEKVNKNSFFISYLKYKDLMIGSVEIPGGSEDADIPDLITIKAYEEFDLDTSKEYKITYNELEHTGSENRIFNLFVIENAIINQIFSPIARKVSYIDYIAAAPLMFAAPYKKNLLSSQSIDAFVVMQNDDAFISVYKNGDYLQSRPLRYSIKTINDKFSALRENRVDELEFEKILKDTEDDIDKEFLSQIFDEISYYISDVLNSISRIYGIKIQNLFILSDIDIAKFYNSLESKIGIPVNTFDLKISINTKEVQVSGFHALMSVFAQDYKDINDDNFNFSLFLRPPPLFKRNSGKLMLYIAAGFLLAFLYPSYQYIYGFITEQNTNILTDEYNIAHAERVRIESTLARLANEYQNTKKVFDEENEKIDFRKGLLTEIYDKKANYPMKSIVLYELTKLISEKDIKVGKVVNTDKNMTIMLLSQNEKQLTEFIENVSKQVKYSITTQEIIFDPNKQNPMYESNVTVKIK